MKYSKTQFKIGMRIEKNHFKNKTITKKIVHDHLNEFPHYYTNLLNMEKRMRRR